MRITRTSHIHAKNAGPVGNPNPINSAEKEIYMSVVCHHYCGSCRYYSGKFCDCDDSGRFLDTVKENRSACTCYSPYRTPTPDRHCETKTDKKKSGKAGPCICEKCGAYIPTGHERCLACGSEITDCIETSRLLLNAGFTHSKPIYPPLSPPLSISKKIRDVEKEIRIVYEKQIEQSRKEEPVDLDLDSLDSNTIRIRYKGEVRTCTFRVDSRSPDFNYADILMFHTKGATGH